MNTKVTSLSKEDVAPIPPWMTPMVKSIMRWYSHYNTWIYQKTGGKWGAKFPGGSPVCLITMTGRKTGKKRTTPLIYVPNGEDVILVASQGGLDTHPLWYHNIVANPEVEVTVGKHTRSMVAHQADDEEKLTLWKVITGVHPDFNEYQARTDRDIPVMVCQPKK